MKNIDTTYLNFNASSIKELIKRKLSEDTDFTDYVYEGSNLSIIIDICANVFQYLMFNLNNAAAESMFSDTQIYENINRLVKLIGYNPRGYYTSTNNVIINGIDNENDGKIILPYTQIDTGKTDINGKKIYYSTVDYWYMYEDSSLQEDNVNNIVVYNGQWKLYNKIFVSEGYPYETFILTDLISDATEKKYIAYPHIHAYIKRYDVSTNTYIWEKFLPTVDGLFVNTENNSSINSSNDKIFELRLNENKQYEIKFGDGIYGKALNKYDEIYIFYLESNGPEGIIQANDISNLKLSHSSSNLGIDEETYNGIFENIINIGVDLTNLTATNTFVSTTPSEEETVEDIKNNAPNWFKSGNRLITKSDFETYIKTRYHSDIVDVVAMNNWEYIATFYKWLYNIGISKYSDGSKYINENILSKYDYKYSDSADSNNIYLWLKMKNDTEIFKTKLDNELMSIKVMTAETVFISPVDVNFMICANPDIEYIQTNYLSDSIFDASNENYIEITIDNSSFISPSIIKSQVNDILIDYFSEENQNIGSFINLNDIYNKIMGINGINRIRTVYAPSDPNDLTIINGLSFAVWSDSVIEKGDDLVITNTSYTLEKFQFPKLYTLALLNHIKVITNNVNQIQFNQY